MLAETEEITEDILSNKTLFNPDIPARTEIGKILSYDAELVPMLMLDTETKPETEVNSKKTCDGVNVLVGVNIKVEVVVFPSIPVSEKT